jgi:DNA primase
MDPWDHQQKIADYIFNESIVEEMLENQIISKTIQIYREMMSNNQEPTDKDFIFSQDNEVSTLVVGLMNSPYELSEHWQAEKQAFSSLEQGFRKYMNIEYVHKPLMKEVKTFKDDVLSTLQFLKLKKIKHLMEQNQIDLEANNSYEKLLELLPSHLHIKEMEMEITKMTGSVIKKL